MSSLTRWVRRSRGICGSVLYTDAGIEIGVAATKTFTTQLALLYPLALRIAHARGALTTTSPEHAEKTSTSHATSPKQ
jgi:glucosamine--fructose-6-phosphate aminotransferase (isomerizing)